MHTLQLANMCFVCSDVIVCESYGVCFFPAVCLFVGGIALSRWETIDMHAVSLYVCVYLILYVQCVCVCVNVCKLCIMCVCSIR